MQAQQQPTPIHQIPETFTSYDIKMRVSGGNPVIKATNEQAKKLNLVDRFWCSHMLDFASHPNLAMIWDSQMYGPDGKMQNGAIKPPGVVPKGTKKTYRLSLSQGNSYLDARNRDANLIPVAEGIFLVCLPGFDLQTGEMPKSPYARPPKVYELVTKWLVRNGTPSASELNKMAIRDNSSTEKRVEKKKETEEAIPSDLRIIQEDTVLALCRAGFLDLEKYREYLKAITDA